MVNTRFKASSIDEAGQFVKDVVYFNHLQHLDTIKTKRILAFKQFELSNHLGNVLATILDRRSLHDTVIYNSEADTAAIWDADIVSAQDYYPGGSILPGRNYTAGSSEYEYGFQGQLKDDEIYGKGNMHEFKFRMNDNRILRFWSVDPIGREFAWNSPYAFSENSLIAFIEFEGLEKVHFVNGNQTQTVDFSTMTDAEIEDKLDELHKYHQGNINLESIKSTDKEEVWQVINQTDYMNASTGTLVRGYASQASYNAGKGKPYTEKQLENWKQWLYSLDETLYGRDGVDEGMTIIFATWAILGSGGSILAGASGFGLVASGASIAFAADDLTGINNGGRTASVKLLENLGIETEDAKAISSIGKLTFSFASAKKGLVKLSVDAADGNTYELTLDALNQVATDASMKATLIQMGQNSSSGSSSSSSSSSSSGNSNSSSTDDPNE